MKHVTRYTILAATLCLTAPSASFALDDYPYQGFAAQMAMIDLQHNLLNRSLGIDNLQDTSYSVDPQIRAKVERQLIAVIQKVDPVQAQNFANAIAQTDFFKLYDDAMARYDLSSGNLGDVMTAYWILQWGSANQNNDDPTVDQVESVRGQVDYALDLEAAGLTDSAARQELAETLVYQTILLSAGIEEAYAKKDTATIQLLSENSHKTMTDLGINMRQLVLTDEGFKPIR